MALERYEGGDCHNSAVQNTEIPVNTTHRCRKYASLCVLTVRDGTLQFQLEPPDVYMSFLCPFSSLFWPGTAQR